jgi:hypothetical protein
MYLTTMGVVNKNLMIISHKEQFKTNSLEIDQVQFNFNGEEWEGLTKIAVFINDENKIFDVPLVNDSCSVPYEVYQSSKIGAKNIQGISSVAVGVYGISIEGDVAQKIHPTNLVSLPLGVGSYFPGVTPGNLPTVDQWEVYMQTVAEISNEANGYMLEAKAYSENAKTSEDNAKASEDNASGYANDALGYKNDAANSADLASGYANDALGYKNNASGSANLASGYANDALGYKNQASGYAEEALGYKNSASDSADFASQYANSALGYKNEASDSATNAEGYASNALGYKNEASNSAELASGYASDASAYAEQALDYKNQAADIVSQINSLEFYLDPQTGDLSYSMD